MQAQGVQLATQHALLAERPLPEAASRGTALPPPPPELGPPSRRDIVGNSNAAATSSSTGFREEYLGGSGH